VRIKAATIRAFRNVNITGRGGSLQVNDELDGDDIEPVRKSLWRDLYGYGERRIVALCSKHRSPKILRPSGSLKLSQYSSVSTW